MCRPAALAACCCSVHLWFSWDSKQLRLVPPPPHPPVTHTQAVLDLQHLPGRLMMKPGVEVGHVGAPVMGGDGRGWGERRACGGVPVQVLR